VSTHNEIPFVPYIAVPILPPSEPPPILHFYLPSQQEHGLLPFGSFESHSLLLLPSDSGSGGVMQTCMYNPKQEERNDVNEVNEDIKDRRLFTAVNPCVSSARNDTTVNPCDSSARNNERKKEPRIYNTQQQERKERNTTTRKNTRRSKNADANPRTSYLLSRYVTLNFESLYIQSFFLYSFRLQQKSSLIRPALQSVSVPQVYKKHPLSPTIAQVQQMFKENAISIPIACEMYFIFLFISSVPVSILLSIIQSLYCSLLDRNPLQQLSSPRQSFIPKVMSIWNIIEAKLQSIINVITLSCDQSLYKISLKLQFFSSDFGKSLIWKCYRLLLSSSKSQKTDSDPIL
jgi:hypothetical protein